MNRRVVRTASAPAAIGPYSQGIVAGDFLFTSGQIGIDAETGELVEGGAVEEARRALSNLQAVVEEAGCALGDVVKVTLYLDDMSDFAAVNEVYAGFFGEDPPARACIEVAALPKGAKVEVEAVASAP